MTRRKKATSILEVLKLGRIFLGRNKWNQGDFYNEANNSYCAIGALHRGMNLESNTEESYVHRAAESYLKSAINQVDPTYPWGVVSYNDKPGTTKKDIVRIFDLAIKIAAGDSK